MEVVTVIDGRLTIDGELEELGEVGGRFDV